VLESLWPCWAAWVQIPLPAPSYYFKSLLLDKIIASLCLRGYEESKLRVEVEEQYE